MRRREKHVTGEVRFPIDDPKYTFNPEGGTFVRVMGDGAQPPGQQRPVLEDLLDGVLRGPIPSKPSTRLWLERGKVEKIREVVCPGCTGRNVPTTWSMAGENGGRRRFGGMPRREQDSAARPGHREASAGTNAKLIDVFGRAPTRDLDRTRAAPSWTSTDPLYLDREIHPTTWTRTTR